MYGFIPSTIQKLEKSYMNAFKLGVSDGNTETFQDPAKQQFKNHFLKLCEIEESNNAETDMIRNFQCSSVENFDSEYNKEHLELKKKATNPQESNRYKRFAEEIDKIVVYDTNEEQNVDNVTMIDADMMVKETQLYIDPISKTQILDPVRNTICGHIYERHTIEGAIRMNARTRCPYMGCSNKQRVAQSHLADDHQLKAKLRQMISQREQEMDEDD